MSDKPLRFCLVTTFYPPYNFGGDGIFVQRLANELARRRHHVDVIHCRDAYRLMAGGEPLTAYDDDPNVKVHGLESRYGLLSPLATQQSGRPLFKSAALKRIFEQPYDVIHFHNISLFGPKILEYGAAVKLYTMHEYWLVCPMHTLFKFNRAPCVKPSCAACTLSYGRPPQWWRYSGLLKTAVRHVDAFIAPSRFIAEKHHEMGFAAPIVYLPHFIPETSDRGSDREPPENEKAGKAYFLFAGRLEKLKGVQTIIPAFRDYAKARLLIAGAGSYEPELRRAAAGSNNIQFLGRCSEATLNSLYRGAVAVIVPSLWYENLPLVILEALRWQTPVIVRDLGALTETVKYSGGGLVYRTDNELLQSMDDLLENPEKCRRLGERGYAAYQRNWTTEVHMQRYLSLIGEIVAKRSYPAAADGARSQDARSVINPDYH